MSAANPIIYYIVFNRPNPCVRAVHKDGTTRTWKPGDPGYKSARSRAFASFRR